MINLKIAKALVLTVVFGVGCKQPELAVRVARVEHKREIVESKPLTASPGNEFTIVHLVGPPEPLNTPERHDWSEANAVDMQGHSHPISFSHEQKSSSGQDGLFTTETIHPIEVELIFELPEHTSLSRISFVESGIHHEVVVPARPDRQE